MKTGITLHEIKKVIFKICHITHRIAGAILIFLVLLLVADAIGRLIGKPITGSYEIVQYGFAIIVAFSVAYTQISNGHVSIELIFDKFPATIRKVLTNLSQILSICIFSLISWRLWIDAIGAFELKEKSSTLGVPVFLPTLILSAGFALLVLVTTAKMILRDDVK